MWSADRDGSLLLSGHAGFSSDEATRWRYVPPGVATVARQALVSRSTVYLDTVADMPSIGSLRSLAAHAHPDDRASRSAGSCAPCCTSVARRR